MAGPLALLLVLGLAGLTFGMRAAGPMLRSIPATVTTRTAGLAPALLAALRVPFIACVIAGALVAAGLRALLHLN